MTELKLDPEGYFRFDLEKGGMGYRDGGRLVAYPMRALLKLLGTSLHDIQKTLPYTVGLHLGEDCGAQVLHSIGSGFLDEDVPPEDFLVHVNAVLALHGLGTMTLETWGDILLVTWKLDTGEDVQVTEFQEGVLAGVLSSVTGQAFEAASVEQNRFIAGNASMVDWTKLWMGEGCGLGEIVDRLHAGKHLQAKIQAE